MALSLFLDPSDVLELRRKSRRGAGKLIAAKIIQGASLWLKKPPVLPPPRPSTQEDRSPGELRKARMAQNCVLNCAMALVLSQDQRYLKRAWAEIECWATKWKSWTDPFHGGKDDFDLMVGEMGLTLGLAYDWLGPFLSDGERQYLAGLIRHRILDCYRLNTEPALPGGREAWWMYRDMNWSPVCHGGAAVAAIALRKHYPAWKKVCATALRAMRPYWQRMARQEGASEEGIGYWQYGLRYGYLALEAMRAQGLSTGGWLQNKKLARSGRYVAAFAPGLQPITWGDAPAVVRTGVLYLIAGLNKDRALLAYADRACLELDERHKSAEAWNDLPFALLWRPASLPLLRRPGRLTQAQHFSEIGWSCIFDNWEEPGMVVGLKCGDLGANHTQLDNNSFQILVNGEALAIDPGPGIYNHAYFSEARWSMYLVATAGHNALLINGKGQREHTLGTLKPFKPGPGLEGAIGDASACYGKGVKVAKRYFVVKPGQWLLTVDEVELSKAGSVEWRLHTFSKAELGKGFPRVRGKKGSLTLASTRQARWHIQTKTLTLPHPTLITEPAVRKKEQVLSFELTGQKRFVVPVLMVAGKVA